MQEAKEKYTQIPNILDKGFVLYLISFSFVYGGFF